MGLMDLRTMHDLVVHHFQEDDFEEGIIERVSLERSNSLRAHEEFTCHLVRGSIKLGQYAATANSCM